MLSSSSTATLAPLTARSAPSAARRRSSQTHARRLRPCAAATTTQTIHNFSAGPATLPKAVLEVAQANLVDWQGSGTSVMEMSHRGKDFVSILHQCEADLRELLAVPANYKVLFLQGGASTQFAAVPLNLCSRPGATGKGDYVVTGAWGKKALAEAGRFVDAQAAATSTDMASIPPASEWQARADADYLHICTNETIGGVEFKSDPPTASERTVLVADMSSNFCSKPVDVAKYGVIYAGAQKNVGPAGLTIAIVRDDLVGSAAAATPAMLDWATAADNDSCYNTPPTWAIYVCGLVFADLLATGGLAAAQQRNEAKAKTLYDAIEASGGFYSCPVAPECRSVMNVPFRVVPNDLEKAFLDQAAARGLQQLKGHRSVGGVRASIYNAMPAEGVEALVAFMRDFQGDNQ